MNPRQSARAVASRGGDVESRFNHLLSVMKDRYLDCGYELDDVHLAEILGVHDGVLRKGKSSSVSPALARAVGAVWQVDLNWLLLGEGEEPERAGPPLGIENLGEKPRISRGRWDEHKVRRLLSERNLSQRQLSDLLDTDPQRAGNLVRGTLRDAELRTRLAGILEVEPDALFLASRPSLRRAQAGRDKSRRRYSFAEIRLALENLLNERLEPALRGEDGGEEGFESTVVELRVPPPPPELSESERERYERNREVLRRWSETRAAFPVPAEVARRYCEEVVGFYDGGRLDDVGGILRDFMQEEEQVSDSRQDEGRQKIELKKGVLVVGGREIEVDDPALLARLPEYLATEAGRRRLLSWLRENVGRQG